MWQQWLGSFPRLEGLSHALCRPQRAVGSLGDLDRAGAARTFLEGLGQARPGPYLIITGNPTLVSAGPDSAFPVQRVTCIEPGVEEIPPLAWLDQVSKHLR